jgi:hypothetical protein
MRRAPVDAGKLCPPVRFTGLVLVRSHRLTIELARKGNDLLVGKPNWRRSTKGAPAGC